MEKERLDAAAGHWIIVEHIDRKINPLSDRLISLEVEKRHLAERMTFLENHFKHHMEKEEEHWASLREEVGSIKKLINKAMWIATGAIGVLTFLWLFGKDIFDIWLKVKGIG